METKAERGEQTAAQRRGRTDERKMKVCLAHDRSNVVGLEEEEGFHVGKDPSSGLILRLMKTQYFRYTDPVLAKRGVYGLTTTLNQSSEFRCVKKNNTSPSSSSLSRF